ncbi:MAG: PAS domain-containing sensor histidine kinase [Bacteroidota bacterium]
MNQETNKKHIRFTSLFVIVLGTIVITGWVLKIRFLTTILPAYVSMKFNTALLFVLIGIILHSIVTEKWIWVRTIFSLLLLVTGITTFLQSILGFNAGIDELFVKDYYVVSDGSFAPGRMAQGTSFSFFLLGVAFLLINTTDKAIKLIAQYLLHFVTLIAFIAIIGYVLGVPIFYKLSALGSMAIHTAIAFCMISIAASFRNQELGIVGLFGGKGVGSIMARQLFPTLTIAVLLLSIIRIYLHRAGLISVEFGIALFATSFILLGLLLISLSARQLNKINIKKNIAEDQLLALNKNLEKIVEERAHELWKSEQLLKGIINNTSAAIFLKDTKGKYLLVNRRFANDFDLREEDIIGKTTFDLFPEEVAAKLVSNESAIIASKEANTAEMTTIVRGVSKTMLTNKFPLFDEQLNVFAICGVATDFTEVKKSRTEQEILSLQLQQKNQQLLNFAHITSHNLRSPVSNLNSLLWLYKESQTEEEKALLFEKFETVIHNLSETLNELIDALKIQEDTGKKRESLLFEEVFKKVKDSMIGKIIETEAVVSYNFTKAPALEYPKLYLESILQNLLSNSLKYRSPLRTPVIYAETLFENGILILKFKDNGLGIDLNRHSDKLFGLNKTFHRHEEAKGVGLFITKTQVEAMGGSITAISEVDKGSTFIIYFNKKSS